MKARIIKFTHFMREWPEAWAINIIEDNPNRSYYVNKENNYIGSSFNNPKGICSKTYREVISCLKKYYDCRYKGKEESYNDIFMFDIIRKINNCKN